MKLSIVIVTWQSVKVVGGCLRSLGSSGAGEILVVDNHSTDGTVSEVRRRFPETGILALPSNLGFAAACNRGLAATTGETVLFLNPDVRALPASVQTLLATLVHHPHAGAVGGLLVGADGLPQPRYLPCPFPTWNGLVRRILLPGSPPAGRQDWPLLSPSPPSPGSAPPWPPPARVVDQVAGACLLVRRSALLRVGGFDEEFWPAWFEDVDLCLRLFQAGYVILHQASAPFVHGGGASVRQMRALPYYDAWYRNLHRYVLKHHGPAAARLLRCLTIPGMGLRAVAILLPGRNETFPRGPRAAAYLHVASRSLRGWRNASRSTS